MPATSIAQRRYMGAELARKRAGQKTKTNMSEEQLSHFAGTSEKGLPKHAGRLQSAAREAMRRRKGKR